MSLAHFGLVSNPQIGTIVKNLSFPSYGLLPASPLCLSLFGIF